MRAVNPFLNSFKLSVVRKETIRRTVKNVPDGVTRIESSHTDYNDVEVDEFAKVYGIAQSVGLINALSPFGLRIFLFIIYRLEKDKDWIRLKQTELMKAFDASETSISVGMKNLIDNGIIAKRANQSEYWINPQVLFSGDRKAYAEMHAPGSIKFIPDKNPTIVDVSETRFDPNKTYLI